MMRTSNPDFYLRGVASLAVLLLAACASSGTPSSERSYRPAPGTAFVVTIAPGETVSEIAQRYRVSAEDIAAMNRLSAREHLVAGDRLYVPTYGTSGARGAMSTSGSSAGSMPSASRIAVTPLMPVSYDIGPSMVPTPVPRPGDNARIAVRTLPDPTKSVLEPYTTPASASRFVWPVRGRILSPFGETAGGGRNDGINIAVPVGTAVQAAGDGVVTYAGNELKGFGNLLLIQHDDGFVTAYAHTDRIAVERGARVRSGDVVAYAGMTGGVSQPQLHFEIRRHAQPVDPASYLGRADNQANRLPREPARS